jgi:subtilase family serine protease
MMQSAAQAESLPTHHVREVVASGEAQFLQAMPPTQTLRINILFPVRDQAGLDEFLQEVYDPSSPSYRQFLTVPEFTARFGPTQQDYDEVARFLEANRMTVVDRAPNRLVLGVTASVAAIEKAFRLEMGVYQHPTEDRTFFAPDREPTVDLRVPLWHIGGLDNYSIPRPAYIKGDPGASNATGSGPGGTFIGSDRRAAYYGRTALTGSGQSVGLFELDGYYLSDVQEYFSSLGQSLNVPINNVLVDGASGGSDGDDTEQAIDIEIAVSMAPALSQVRVYIGPLGSFTDGVTDTDIFNKMATEDIAEQISCSWVWKPDDPGSINTPGTNDYIFKEIASQGQNLFVASGDWGSYPNSTGFYYPPEDAHVTGVGGTILTTNGAGGPWASEIAWGTTTTSCPPYSSGGGISPDKIPIPSYQQLSGVINSRNGGSTSYRNVPDVAAEANCDNYWCANKCCYSPTGSCNQPVGGTSLAAPTWAGYLALANQYYAANGYGKLGFINPPIYEIGVGSTYSTAFHDITSGSNGGFSAVTGYDLVTGWGTPYACGLIAALTTAPCQPADSVSPTSLSFISTSGSADTKTATLTNNGPGTLAIYSVQVTGNSAFSLTYTSCGTQLAQGSTCYAQVTFQSLYCLYNPTGQLTFSTDSTTGGQTVSLTGRTKACIAVVQPPPAQSAGTK